MQFEGVKSNRLIKKDSTSAFLIEERGISIWKWTDSPKRIGWTGIAGSIDEFLWNPPWLTVLRNGIVTIQNLQESDGLISPVFPDRRLFLKSQRSEGGAIKSVIFLGSKFATLDETDHVRIWEIPMNTENLPLPSLKSIEEVLSFSKQICERLRSFVKNSNVFENSALLSSADRKLCEG